MAGKVKDSRVRKCPRCSRDLRRVEVAGDEKEVVVSDVCFSCGFDSGERIERRRK